MEKKLDLILQKLNDLEKRVGAIEESLSSYMYLSSTYFQDDEKIGDAIRLIRNLESLDCSLFQEQLNIGYARAYRIMDQLAEKKYVTKQKKSNKWKVNKEQLKKEVEQEKLLFKKAIGIIQEFERASASLLQRRLKLNYSQAAKLLDRLEEEGYVGPPDGSKPREVLKKS